MKESINFAKTGMLIRKPQNQVFEAFINPDITTKFWFTHSSGKLEEGNEVTWKWEMYNVSAQVKVKKVEPNKKIIIEWGQGKDKSTVEWEFKSLGEEKTYVSITNSDIQGSGNDLTNRVVDSMGGFSLLVAGLKAWLEHGIQLNLVADKFPKELMSE